MCLTAPTNIGCRGCHRMTELEESVMHTWHSVMAKNAPKAIANAKVTVVWLNYIFKSTSWLLTYDTAGVIVLLNVLRIYLEHFQKQPMHFA
jgi:hypothetical protein